jgi:hypothetical protein
MKRLQLIIGILFCVLTTVNAQYYSVNYDKQTVAAMAGAYNAEAVTEAYYNQQVQSILKHYSAAEVASAGIYASKFLGAQSPDKPRYLDKFYRELLLPSYISHGLRKDYA